MSEMTPHLCRASRALLGWSRQDLAEATRVSLPTVEAYEAADTHGCRWALEPLLMRTLKKAGIQIFMRDDWGGPGVRLQQLPDTFSNDLAAEAAE